MSRWWNSLGGLLSWARVARSRASAGSVGKVQTQAHQDDELQHWQPYGFQSRPKPDAVAVLAAIGGQADQQIALLVGDRRYTLALEEGEVAMADDLGNKVHLARTGIVVVANVVTVQSPDVRLGSGPTYRRPICVGDEITGLVAPAGGGPVTGTISGAAPGSSHVTVS